MAPPGSRLYGRSLLRLEIGGVPAEHSSPTPLLAPVMGMEGARAAASETVLCWGEQHPSSTHPPCLPPSSHGTQQVSRQSSGPAGSDICFVTYTVIAKKKKEKIAASRGELGPVTFASSYGN